MREPQQNGIPSKTLLMYLHRLLLPIAYMVVLYALSSIPGDQSASDTLAGEMYHWVAPQWQNLLHIPLYAGLTLCWIWALSSHPLQRHTQMIIAISMSMLWAVLDEAHQTTVPGRDGSLTDIMLNLTGAGLATIYAWHRAIPAKNIGEAKTPD